MKEIIKDTFNGEIFNNFFRFIKNKLNNEEIEKDTVFLNEFNKKIKEATGVGGGINNNQFIITEKGINEQTQYCKNEIIIPEIENLQIAKNQTDSLVNDNHENYQQYKKDKFKHFSKKNEYEYNENRKEESTNSKKEKKLPKNVKKALNGERIPLPVFEKENHILQEIQKEKDSSRIAI